MAQQSELYCPVGRVSSSNGKKWYEIRFGIGKMGNTKSYENVSKLASLMMNNPDSSEILEALNKLKTYKDKRIKLSFSFHPWKSQNNDGMLKFIDINKAFAKYINELYFGLTLSNDIPNDTFVELFKIIKHNCLFNKLSYIRLNAFGSNYHDIINQCLINHIFTINPIQYQQNQYNKVSKLTLDLHAFFSFYDDQDHEQSVNRMINFNNSLGNAAIIRDLHCDFSITNIIKYMSNTSKQYDFMKAFFNAIYKNAHIISLQIKFSNVWWLSISDDMNQLNKIFKQFWDGLVCMISNRKLIRNNDNFDKYISHDFDDMKIKDIYPLIPLIISLDVPSMDAQFVDDAYKTLRDANNLSKLFDKIGDNRNVVIYKLILNRINFNSKCLKSLLQNVLIKKSNNNILSELSLIGEYNHNDKNTINSLLNLISYILDNNDNMNDLNSIDLGVYDMKCQEIENKLINLIKNAKINKINLQFEDLYVNKVKMYYTAYFNAIFNILNGTKVIIETLKHCRSIPHEIIRLILDYRKYTQFHVYIKQPIKSILHDDGKGVKYEHNWNDLKTHKLEFIKIITENIEKIIVYFDEIINDNKDIYHIDLNLNKTISNTFQYYMKLIFQRGTDIKIQNFSIKWMQS